jgi:hypothetical protein
MKHLLIVSLPILFFVSCNNHKNDAEKVATEIESVSKTTRAGTVATEENGWSLKAKINGKEWVADAMMPPDAAGRIIGYLDKEYIGLPYSRQNLVEGKKIAFGENDAADLSTSGDIGMWGGKKGEMEITKIHDDWVEGKFYFTGSSSRSDKTTEVTDGFFRISLAKTP